MCDDMSGNDTEFEEEILLCNTEMRKYEDDHRKVLEETISVSNAFLISSSIGFFSESMMLTTWILFAKTLNDCSDESITVLVFLQSILQVVGILVTSSLSDVYGFDIITIFTATLLLISAFLHSISYSVITLGIGIAIKGLVMDDIEVLSLGFIAKLLPYNDAAVYSGYWYSYTTLTFLLGIICGGLLSSYTLLSYRMVFIVSLIIILFRWIFVLIKIRNTQNVLIQKQLSFVRYYIYNDITKIETDIELIETVDIETEMTEYQKTWFPLCLEQIRNKNEHENNTSVLSLSTFHIIELGLNIIQFSLISCFIIVTFQFISVYMFDRFGLSVFWSTSQIISGIVPFGVISFILPDYTKNWKRINKYLICTPLYIIDIVIFVVVIPLSDVKHIYLFWVLWPILGSVQGALFVISEICILELQPKQHSGKINGIKTAGRFGVGAIVAALVAYLWNTGVEHVWFCYVQGIEYAMALLINVFLIIMTGAVRRHKVYSKGNNA
eukprot:528728_1